MGETTTNADITALVSDIQQAIDDQTGAGIISVSSDVLDAGTFLTLSSSASFSLNALANDPAVTELGLPQAATAHRFDGLVSAGASGDRLGLIADSSVLALTLSTQQNDPAVREMGFQMNQVARGPLKGTTATVIDFVVDGENFLAGSTFEIVKSDETTISVPVPFATTIAESNSSTPAVTLAMLVADLNAALASKSLNGLLRAEEDNGAILLRLIDDASDPVQFRAALDSPLVLLLGLPDVGIISLPTIAAVKDVPSVVGRISAVSTFRITVDGEGTAVPVTIPKTGTDPSTGNSFPTSLLSLVKAVNDAIDETSLAGRISAESVGSRLVIGAIDSYVLTGTTVAAFALTTDPDDTAETTFTLRITTDDGSADTLITLAHADTVDNTELADLAEDLDDVMASAVGGFVRVQAVGGALRLRSRDESIEGFELVGGAADLGLSAGSASLDHITGFELTGASDLDVLGLIDLASGLTANDVDFVITVSNPGSATQPYNVTLDSVTQTGMDLAAVIAAINTQTGGDVTATINDAGTGLLLTDNTFVEVVTDEFGNLVSNPNAQTFALAPINGSGAGADLGLIGIDNTDESALDGRIDGAQIGGVKLSDRFFIKDASAKGGAHVVHARWNCCRGKLRIRRCESQGKWQCYR